MSWCAENTPILREFARLAEGCAHIDAANETCAVGEARAFDLPYTPRTWQEIAAERFLVWYRRQTEICQEHPDCWRRLFRAWMAAYRITFAGQVGIREEEAHDVVPFA